MVGFPRWSSKPPLWSSLWWGCLKFLRIRPIAAAPPTLGWSGQKPAVHYGSSPSTDLICSQIERIFSVCAMFESPGGIPWNCPATWRVCHHQKSSAMDAWQAERHAPPGCCWPGACSPQKHLGDMGGNAIMCWLGSNNGTRCSKHSV